MRFLFQLKFFIVCILSLFNFNAIAGLTAEATPTSSPSSNDGTIDLTITGGFAPYEISWKGPGGYTSSEEDLEDLASGTIDPIHEQIIRDISELENGAQAIGNYDFEVKDPMNHIVYSKNGAREMTANERSEYTENPSRPIKQKINIFPNPSLGNYHINIIGHSEGKIKIRVYNLQGYLLQEENWLNLQGTLILKEQIAPGIYIIEFLGSDWNARERIIKLQ